MVDYYYPFWRRVVFLALLVLIVSVTLVPAVSKGTVNIQLSIISVPEPVHHLFLKVSEVELHTTGLPSSMGWVSATAGLPTVDIAGSLGASPIISTPIQSGRYDTLRITISQATFIEGALTTKTACSSTCPQVVTNATLAIPPQGYGSVLLVLSPDYSGLLGQSPTLSLSVVDVRSG